MVVVSASTPWVYKDSSNILSVVSITTKRVQVEDGANSSRKVYASKEDFLRMQQKKSETETK